MSKIWGAWNQFWFQSGDLLSLSAFRFFFSLVVFIMYSLRFLEFSLFFSDEGLLPFSQLDSYFLDYLQPPLFIYSSINSLNVFLYIIFLILLLLMVLGLANRTLTLATFILHLVFVQRNPAIIYGADLVTTFWLFYLSFINHSQYFTAKKWISFLKKRGDQSIDMFSSMGYRLIQIQLCIIYAYTGMEKLKGTTWWEGSALWYVMGNENIVPFDFSFFQYFPWAIAVMTYSTLIFEIYFPIAIWLKPLRNVWMLLGICLHGLAAIFMGLIFFSPIMLSSYILFFHPDLIKKSLHRLRRFPQVLKFINI